MERDERKGRLVKPLELLNRYKYVLLVVALGAILLAWPTDRAAEEVSSAAAPADREVSLTETEGAMEAILGKISGVGRVDVMLTLQSGSERVLASDTTLRYSGSSQSPDDYDRTSDTVLVSNGGGEDVVVTQERYPQYRGALVVCDGGGSDAVRLAVVEAVSALTGLGSDKIAVVKWQSGSTSGNE